MGQKPPEVKAHLIPTQPPRLRKAGRQSSSDVGDAERKGSRPNVWMESVGKARSSLGCPFAPPRAPPATRDLAKWTVSS